MTARDSLRSLETELRRQLRERPYWTTGMLVGVGWIVGRTLPVRVLFSLAAFGARTVLFTSVESAVMDQIRPHFGRDQQQETIQ